MKSEPRAEHKWLQQLIGEWTFESECQMGPGQPPAQTSGTESVRSLGDLWVIGEGQGSMPGGGTCSMNITLGFDPAKARFVGTFIVAIMPGLWIYDGALDSTGRILTLDTEGPAMFANGTRRTRYQDIIELPEGGGRLLRSRMLDEAGNWNEFMVAKYRRRT
ncbi:MAG TPA: DUF1579 domain-containing protein [Hyphomicrobiaceae bacterium]|nr:DUF1579 domain-containing protein [Hyphomicrobiaceae bacterium]